MSNAPLSPLSVNVSNLASGEASAAVYRLDRFVVPAAAMERFMARVRVIDQAVSVMDGCRQNLVLTQQAGNGDYHVATLVEWENPAAVAAAKAAMAQRYAQEGFEPAAFMQQIGVRAEMGNYSRAP
jgi:heme-degrading monooxygenase HmoA